MSKAGVFFVPQMSKVQRAIAVVDSSRQTHLNWIAHLHKHPADLEAAELVGDVAWHEECVANYDEVLAVLGGIDEDM